MSTLPGMAEEPKPLKKKGAYFDVDSDDSFLDLPRPKYQGGQEKFLAGVDDLVEKARRGEVELPKLPPPVDH